MDQQQKSFNTRVGKMIMYIRMQKQYSRECLSELADISTKYLYDIEYGRKCCSSYVLFRLAQALEVNVNCLVGEAGTDISAMYDQFSDNQKEKMNVIIRVIYEIAHDF